MAQLGRISGPLLVDNLERQGVNLSFRNDLDTTQLLFLDVNNGLVGVNKAVPNNQLDVSGTTSTIALFADTSNLANFSLSNNTIDVSFGDISVNASEEIISYAIETPSFTINDNTISTNENNTDIVLDPYDTSTVEVLSDLNVTGSLHATGNITLDGTVTFGDTIAQDTVTFNTDIQSDIIPNINDTYDLGSTEKRWNNLYTNLVNGQSIQTNELQAGGINFNQPVGNIFYVSKNGDNSAKGDTPQAPLATIEEALARVDSSTDGPVKIHVFSGTYVENTPLVIPPQTTIVGENIRSVIVSGNNTDKDIFLMNGETTVSNLTIKDFYYNSINNTGYAFRFAPNTIISTRSPYIQNISVITSGSVTSADDPRGFDQGDAGKGALVDGADVLSASQEASMLFHSVTFITPGVDALTMTNGVRVEWLNSFSYFANRGLYAVDGVTGHLSTDGSTIKYGAEIRSIGSANVYGNYGAVADGADTLMYLIQHNFGYIGAGKFVDNDASRAIQSQEVTELNNGQIHFVTTDHIGNFRVGDNFFIDFETGSTSIDASGITQGDITTINIDDGVNRTVIDNSKIQTGNIRFINNNIESISTQINFSPTTDISINNNVNIEKDLDITGNLNFDGSLNLIGNESTDTVKFNVNINQDFNPDDDATYNLGSFAKRWSNIWLSKAYVDDIEIYDNVIGTTDSNSNLEIRANGVSDILIPTNNTQINQTLTVNGTTNLSNTNTLNITHIGDVNHTGNLQIGNNAIINNLLLDQIITFDEIQIDDNFITTTSSNANLELRAVGTGNVIFDANTIINGSLSFTNLTASTATITTSVESNDISMSGIDITGQTITTNLSNSNLEISSTKDIILENNTLITQNLDVNGTTSIGLTNISGSVSILGNVAQTGNYDIAGELTVDNVYLEDNFITTKPPIGEGFLTYSTNYESDSFYDGAIFISLGNDVVISPPEGFNIFDPAPLNVYIDFYTSDKSTLLARIYAKTWYATSSDFVFVTHVLPFNTENNLEVIYPVDANSLLDVNFVEDETYYISAYVDLELRASGTGNVVIQSNAQITNNLQVNGSTELSTVNINGLVTHTGNRIVNGNLIINGDYYSSNIVINDNYITTVDTNSDIELRANGTGTVTFENSTIISNQLEVSGNTVFDNGADINGGLTLTGNTTQTGDYTLLGELFVDNIKIEDNFITTTPLNTNLILESGISNNVLFNENVTINNNSIIGTLTATDTNINGSLDIIGNRIHTGQYFLSGELFVDDIKIEDNFITSLQIDQNLIINAARNIVVPSSNTVIENNLTVSGSTSLEQTTVTGNITHNGNRNQTNVDQEPFLFYTNANGLGSSTFVWLERFDALFGQNRHRVHVFYKGNEVFNSGQSTGDGSVTPGSVIVGSDSRQYIVGDLQGSGGSQFGYPDEDEADLYYSVQRTDELISVDAQFDLLGELVVDNVYIEDNFITTTSGNLTLASIGDINIENNNVKINQDLTVSGIINLNNTNIVGTITHTGNLSVDNNYSLDNISVTRNLLTGSQAQFEEIRFDGNVITTTTSNADLELRASGSGKIVFSKNTIVSNNVSANNLIVNQDILIDRDFLLNEIIIPPNVLEVDDNFISTTVSNEDLELRANGSGEVIIDDSATVSNNLNIAGLTSLHSTEINGSLSVTGNISQSGNITTTGNLLVNNFTTTQAALLKEIDFLGNLITTRTPNVNLELKASGTGSVILDNLKSSQDLQADTLNDVESIIVNNTIDFETLELSTDIQMFDNVVTTTNSNSNLELRSVGNIFVKDIQILDNSIITQTDLTLAGNNVSIDASRGLKIPSGTDAERNFENNSIRFNTDSYLFEGIIETIYSNIGGGIYSSDRLTSLTIDPRSNTIRFITQGDVAPIDSTTLSMRIDENAVKVSGVQVDDINISNNTISTNVSNSDLEIVIGNASTVNLENIAIQDNKISTSADTNLKLGGTGRQWVVFEGNSAVKFPSGTTAERPLNPTTGLTRHNTDSGELETWTGTEWKSSVGDVDNVTVDEMDNEAFVQTLIYG